MPAMSNEDRPDRGSEESKWPDTMKGLCGSVITNRKPKRDPPHVLETSAVQPADQHKTEETEGGGEGT